MTFDPSKPVRTRDGREVTLWDVRQGTSYPGGPIIGVVHNTDQSLCLLTWHKDGRPAYTEMSEGCRLINIPEEHEIVVFLKRKYRSEDLFLHGTNLDGDAIASKRVTFTEGEFEEMVT